MNPSSSSTSESVEPSSSSVSQQLIPLLHVADDDSPCWAPVTKAPTSYRALWPSGSVNRLPFSWSRSADPSPDPVSSSASLLSQDGHSLPHLPTNGNWTLFSPEFAKSLIVNVLIPSLNEVALVASVCELRLLRLCCWTVGSSPFIKTCFSRSANGRK